MRGGGGQRTGVGGRGRGRGDGRHRSSSPSNFRDRRRGSRYPQSHCSISSLADRQGPRQSLSPLPSRLHRSPSDRNYTLRQPEHGRHRGPTSVVEDGGMLPHYLTDLNDVRGLLKSSSQSFKNKDLGDGSSSLAIDSQGTLVRKSLYMNDGSEGTFYTLPQDPGRPFDSSVLRSVGSSVSVNVGMPRHDQRMRDPYNDKEGQKLYARDVSYPVMSPYSEATLFVGNSSSSFRDTDALQSHGNRDGLGKFLGDTLEHNSYNQVQLSEHVRRAPVSPPAREEPLEYGYSEAAWRGRDDHGYLPSDDPQQYHKKVYGAQGEYRDPTGTFFSVLAGGRVDRADDYHKKFNKGRIWDQNSHQDMPMGFHDLKVIHNDYDGSSGSGYVGHGPEAARDHVPSFEEDAYHYGRGTGPVAHRERLNSPLLVDHHLDAYMHAVRSPRGESRSYGDFDDVDPSLETMVRRAYVMTDELNGHHVHRRIQPPIHDDDIFSNEEYAHVEEKRRFLHPKKPVIQHSQYKSPLHKLPRNDKWVQSGYSSPHVGGSRGISLNKRLRPGPSDCYGKEISRPHKVWKRDQEDGSASLNAPEKDVQFDGITHIKKDPPEGSEEFKQQVHKAFLRFTKLLNESPHQQKRFRDDQEKSSKLLCCVCGRLSKEFVDVHCLLTHCYQSLKVGLRTDHLGLHKALCVLNGWNWLLAPDTSKSYRRGLPSELKALKEDLILWPPIVIIHNSSIGNKGKTSGPRVVSIERMKEILKEMGFGAGKTNVSRGKPANQSVLIVKFMPTLSGLQEAERLHKYYADKKQGREGFQQITSDNGSNEESRVEKDEELLYGYIAVADDLDKLDPETKKRSLVKSKKEIDAIADAPLKID